MLKAYCTKVFIFTFLYADINVMEGQLFDNLVEVLSCLAWRQCCSFEEKGQVSLKQSLKSHHWLKKAFHDPYNYTL